MKFLAEGLLTLLTAELRRVHRLAQNLDSHGTSLLQSGILLVILFEQALGAGIVGTNAGRLPPAVVSTRVALVQLELAEVIPPSVDERYTERTETTVLGIPLLQVTQPAHKLLAGNVFVVGEEVALGVLTSVVDQDVGIGVHASHCADHVTVINELAVPYRAMTELKNRGWGSWTYSLIV